jgi:hypothetical protein
MWIREGEAPAEHLNRDVLRVRGSAGALSLPIVHNLGGDLNYHIRSREIAPIAQVSENGCRNRAD